MPITQLRHIYQLKINLVGIQPPIWRRILVPSHITLADLHITFQISMGWTNSHLHQFIANKKVYGMIDDELDYGMDMEDEELYKLNQILSSEKDKLIYEYDFGDGWEHQVILEKILPFNTDNKLPQCIKGKRACPPEDCGGIWGYGELLDTLNDPEDPEHQSMLEWLDGNFDSEAFDMKEINELLIEYVH